MVELRSGKRVDLSLLKKTTSGRVARSDSKTMRSSKQTNKNKIEQSFDFEIFEDDPLIPRSDLDTAPLSCWQAAAVDKENEEPCYSAPVRSHATRDLSLRPDASAQSRMQPSAGFSVVVPGSTSRPPLHQLSQDEQGWESGAMRKAGGAFPKGVENLRNKLAQKLPDLLKPSEQAQPLARDDPKQAKTGAKRVSILDLR